MRAGQEQDPLYSRNVSNGTGIKWLGLSKLEVIWVLSGSASLLLSSIYLTGLLEANVQLPISELAENYKRIQAGIYFVAGLGAILLLVGAALISRRGAAAFTSSDDKSIKALPAESLVSDIPESLLLKSNIENFHPLDTSPSLVYIKDANLNYTFANKKWLETYDLTLSDVIGKCDLDVFGEKEYFLNRVKSENNALNGVALLNMEERITTDHGEMIVLSNLLPLNQGQSSELISWCTDITYLRRDFDELDQARQQADSSNQAKSSFLATMSHEIRTPMNGVVGSLDLLRISELDDSQSQLIDTINESAFALLTIIDDILDFSKIESGKLNLERVPVSFERLLGSVAASLIPNAQQKEVELLFYSDINIPDVYADLVRLRQIISNLGSNAIKFTGGKDDGKGVVIIRCTLLSVDNADNATINISVEDNGIGLSEEAQTQLFQPFVQAEGSTTRRFGGSGLGLSITSRLTEMMNGEIGVRSKLGEGAVFTASIPFAVVANEGNAVGESNLSGLPVLFIKGEERVNELFVKHLKNEGMSCYEVSRQKEEWSQVMIENNGQLVIIIVDCWANDLGVPALKRELEKQFSYIDKVSFLILSQGYLMEPQLQTKNTTKLDYNGLGRRAFLKAIDNLVNKPSAEAIKTDDGAEAGLAEENRSSTASKKLLLLAEDNKINQKVLKHQLGVLGYLVRIANDGEEALSMWKHERDKFELILTDCHMPNLDGYGLAKAIRNLEMVGEKEGENQVISKRVPIIAITADALQGADEQCRRSGMDDYLTKPLLISDLSEKLEKWLTISTDVVEPKAGATELGETVNVGDQVQQNRDADVVDPETLKGFLGTSDRSKLRDFYLQFQQSSAPIVSDISKLSKKESWSGVEALAHQLKSSSYAIGAKSLGDLCLALELPTDQVSSSILELSRDEMVKSLLLKYSEVDAWIETNYA